MLLRAVERIFKRTVINVMRKRSKYWIITHARELYTLNNGKYLFAYKSGLLLLLLRLSLLPQLIIHFIIVHFCSYTYMTTSQQDLFKWLIYCTIIATCGFYSVASLFVRFSPIFSSWPTLLIAIYYSCKWADSLISAMTRVHNEPENVCTNEWYPCSRNTCWSNEPKPR